MAKTTSRPKLNAQILEEASQWFVDLSEGDVDAAGREEFSRWLRASPEHVRACLQISAFWEDAGLLNKDGKRDTETLIARALTEANVFPLDLAGGPEPAERALGAPRAVKWQAGRRRLAIAASVAVLCVAGAAAYWLQTERIPTYSTDAGEQRSITLADGSTVELNSRSRVRVRFTEGERAVELVEGQALFHVAKNALLPFVVRSDGTSVRAVGTRFDVYKKSSGTIVTVVEGRVAVSRGGTPQENPRTLHPVQAASPASLSEASGTAEIEKARAARAEILLSAGEQVTVTSLAVAPPRRANIAAATAWTQKKLVFESSPLSEVVAEFNRYNRRQLVIQDPELYDFHISGVFASTDSDRMVEFLRQRFGVDVDESGDDVRISRK